MNEKERLLKVLKGELVDRPPVICPGGMMSSAVTELLQDLDESHNLNYKAMAEVSERIYNKAGFENLGVPFAMIAEAEAFGAQIQTGDKETEERVVKYSADPLEDIIKRARIAPRNEKRMNTVICAVEELKNNEVPVIGNITGHMSTATSVVDPLILLKMLRKEPDRACYFFRFINDYLKTYAKELVSAGADIITISDPTATGEILGGKNFEKFCVPLYHELTDVIHKVGAAVIIHICGNAGTILDGLNRSGADVVSFDSVVNIKYAKANLKPYVMGNVSTQLLHTGKIEKIAAFTKNCIDSGVDIVSPACGLSMATPVDNLRAMTDLVKNGAY